MPMDKKYSIYITNYALDQMQKIKRYIAEELLAPQAAKDLLSAMRDAAASLEGLPFRNPLLEEDKWREQGIRKIVVKNFLMYYWINEEKRTVYVTAVIYGKRNQLNELEKMLMK